MFGTGQYLLSLWQDVILAQYRAAGRKVELVPFSYNATFQPINASATATQPNTTDGEGDFHVCQTAQVAINAGTGAYVQYPNLTCLITWDVSGRTLQDRAMHIINMFGRGDLAHDWIQPARVPPKSTWSTTLTNLDAAVNYNIFLAFHGVKAIPSN
jgi:hypothetical protein